MTNGKEKKDDRAQRKSGNYWSKRAAVMISFCLDNTLDKVVCRRCCLRLPRFNLLAAVSLQKKKRISWLFCPTDSSRQAKSSPTVSNYATETAPRIYYNIIMVFLLRLLACQSIQSTPFLSLNVGKKYKQPEMYNRSKRIFTTSCVGADWPSYLRHQVFLKNKKVTIEDDFVNSNGTNRYHYRILYINLWISWSFFRGQSKSLVVIVKCHNDQWKMFELEKFDMCRIFRWGGFCPALRRPIAQRLTGRRLSLTRGTKSHWLPFHDVVIKK